LFYRDISKGQIAKTEVVFEGIEAWSKLLLLFNDFILRYIKFFE
jgi:hypothetical protein